MRDQMTDEIMLNSRKIFPNKSTDCAWVHTQISKDQCYFSGDFRVKENLPA